MDDRKQRRKRDENIGKERRKSERKMNELVRE
jgi:hypothetical protein